MPRHSVKNRRNFDFLLSDIDVDLLVSSKIQEKTLKKILKTYQAFRKVFWPLGELEIYTFKDYALRKKANDHSSGIYHVIWLLRKWKWQEAKLVQPMHAYHKYKLATSNEKIFFELSDAAPFDPNIGVSLLSEAVDNLFKKIQVAEINFKDVPKHWTSNYLGWKIDGLNSKDSEALKLSEKSRAVLFALSPELVTDDVNQILLNIRSSEILNKYFVIIVLNELLLCRSSIRTESKNEINQIWVDYLLNQLRLYDFQLYEQLMADGEALADF